jgi:hypothetical protein
LQDGYPTAKVYGKNLHCHSAADGSEAEVKQVLGALAFLASLVSLLVIAGGGIALFAIENSGERGTGALLAFGGILAFCVVLTLVFAKDGTFAGPVGRAMAITAAIAGALPVAALSFAAVRFAGLPIGSGTAALDWSVLLVGVGLAIGTLAILALGHRRSQERTRDEEEAASEAPVVVHMQQIRHAQQQLRSALAADRRNAEGDAEDVRVRQV